MYIFPYVVIEGKGDIDQHVLVLLGWGGGGGSDFYTA